MNETSLRFVRHSSPEKVNRIEHMQVSGTCHMHGPGSTAPIF